MHPENLATIAGTELAHAAEVEAAAGRSWAESRAGSGVRGATLGMSAKEFPQAEWDAERCVLTLRCGRHVRAGQPVAVQLPAEARVLPPDLCAQRRLPAEAGREVGGVKGVQIQAEFAGGASVGPVDVEVPPARATFCDAVVTVSAAVGLGYLAAELHATSARLAAARRHDMARSDLGRHPHTESKKQNTRQPEASALMAQDLAPDAGAGMAAVNARMPPVLVRLERRAKRLRRQLLRLIGGAVTDAAHEDAVVAVEVM